MWIERELVVWLAILVQVLGVVGVTLSRLDWSRSRRRTGRWAVLGCFILVGVVSIAAIRACDRCWLIFAATLPLMAVGATIDLGKSENSAGF